MVLVFILCFTIILIALLVCMIILSTLQFELRHFRLGNIKKEPDKPFSKNYQFKISLKLLGKVKWIGICLNAKRVKKIKDKIKWQKIDLKKMEQSLRVEDIRQVKKLQPKLKYLKLDSKIGVEDVIATSFIVGILASIISIILPHMIDQYEKNKYHYEIVPLYWNKNVYEIKFDGIIEIKMVHIINILYYFLKKRRGENYEQRASNRRTYGYSYE